jgi:hypothetical protein
MARLIGSDVHPHQWSRSHRLSTKIVDNSVDEGMGRTRKPRQFRGIVKLVKF